MYAVWQFVVGLFLRRRVVVTLTNGQRVVHTRPKGTTREGYRREFDAWRAAANHKILLEDAHRSITVTSNDIVSVEVR
jgi:hypothetical protein